jgi:RNA polymerase sigma-70 factor (ECF subfamily)
VTRSPEFSDRLAQCLARTALGDRKAFAELYDATSAHLLGVILRIVRQREPSEDVLQEVYVNVWKSAGSYDAALSQPLTWLSRIARNRAIDSLRRDQTKPQTVSAHGEDDAEGDDDLLERQPDDSPGPLDLLVHAAEAHALRDCMSQLGGEQQQALALAFYQGLSHSEVADHLNQPLGTVKSWVRRALQALKGCLDRATGGER